MGFVSRKNVAKSVIIVSMFFTILSFQNCGGGGLESLKPNALSNPDSGNLNNPAPNDQSKTSELSGSAFESSISDFDANTINFNLGIKNSEIQNINLGGGSVRACLLTTKKDLYCWSAGNQPPINLLASNVDSFQTNLNNICYLSQSLLTCIGSYQFQMNDVIEFKLAEQAACLLTGARQMHCWGKNNADGILGPNASLVVTAPAKVLDNVVHIGLSTTNACAVTTSDQLYCWGFRPDLVPAGPSWTLKGGWSSGTPVLIQTMPGISRFYESAYSGNTNLCFQMSNGVVRCTHNQYLGGAFGKIFVPNGNFYDFKFQVKKWYHSLAGYCWIDLENKLYCPGLSYPDIQFGAVAGRASLMSEYVYVDSMKKILPLMTNVQDLFLGELTSCLRFTNGNIRCNFGRSMTPAPTDINPVVHDQQYIQFSLGTTSACGVTVDNKLYCWGLDPGGSFPQSARYVMAPFQIDFKKPIFSVAVGNSTVCAATATEVLCFGDSQMAKPENPFVIPVAGVTQMAVLNSGDVCLLASDKRVGCFGPSVANDLGLSDFKKMQWLDLPPIAKIKFGGSILCALDQSSNLYCIGDNSWKQIENSTEPRISVLKPLQVASDVADFLASAYDIRTIHNTAPANCRGVCNDKKQIWGHRSWSEQNFPAENKDWLLSGNQNLNLVNNCVRGSGTYTCGDFSANWLQDGAKQTAIAYGGTNICQLGADRKLRCWGDNRGNVLGSKSYWWMPLRTSF